MTAEKRQELLNLLKQNEVLVDLQNIENGTDERGFPTFKTEYINPPLNYKLVRIIAPYLVAVLEDLNPIGNA